MVKNKQTSSRKVVSYLTGPVKRERSPAYFTNPTQKRSPNRADEILYHPGNDKNESFHYFLTQSGLLKSVWVIPNLSNLIDQSGPFDKVRFN